jgi:hypothetical protein
MSLEDEMLESWLIKVEDLKPSSRKLDYNVKYDECLNFNGFMADIWPKYKQICLIEFAQEAKQNTPLLLDDMQFLTLPESA